MLAKLQKVEEGYRATFDRHLPQPIDDVWVMLTDNDKLPLWFSELKVKDLRVGGIIEFNMPDGSTIDMEITDFKARSILEYTWGEDLVRFELSPEAEGTHLILTETIYNITDHTSKDLAGWHVCLDVIAAILDGRKIESRKEEWKKWYEQYTQAVNELS